MMQRGAAKKSGADTDSECEAEVRESKSPIGNQRESQPGTAKQSTAQTDIARQYR